MKIDVSICRPVYPLYIISFPYGSIPYLSRKMVARSSTVVSLKGEPSPRQPVMHPTFESRVSMSCAIVMRDGIACGLIIISGTIPDAVWGMSSGFKIMPIVPFCPCRELLPVQTIHPFRRTKKTSLGTRKQYTFPAKCAIFSV